MTFFAPNGNPTDSLPRPFETLRGLLGRSSTSFQSGFTTYFSPFGVGPCLGVNTRPCTTTIVSFIRTAGLTAAQFSPPNGNAQGAITSAAAGWRTRVAINDANSVLLVLEARLESGSGQNTNRTLPINSALVQTWVLSDTNVKVFMNGALVHTFASPARAVANTSQVWLLNVAVRNTTATASLAAFAQEVEPIVVSDDDVLAHQADIIAGRRLYRTPGSARWDLQHLPLGVLPKAAGSAIDVGRNGMPNPNKTPFDSAVSWAGEMVDFSNLQFRPVT